MNAKQIDESEAAWSERERLWQGVPGEIVCKLSVPPTRLGWLCETVRRVASPLGTKWELIAQGFGVALLRVEGTNERALVGTLGGLQGELRKIEGSLVVLYCPLEIKRQIDVWGDPGDALPLMRRIKEQFDPTGVLNPGRFVGGI